MERLTGSSPRVWGTRGKRACRSAPLRFIPTCVGNSFSRAIVRSTVLVHPHVCGELKVSIKEIRDAIGSSPRVWGTHWRDLLRRLIYGSSPRVWGTQLAMLNRPRSKRFIPTCVGNSQPRFFYAYNWPVHPHVCGELR